MAEATLPRQTLVDQVAVLQIFLLQQVQPLLDKAPLVAMAELVGLVLAAVLEQ
jgi:hypothetical protein